MDLVRQLAPLMTPYLSITGLTGGHYTYKKRFADKPFPIVDLTMHQKKGALGGMLYMAIAAGANLQALARGQKLYVGSQSGPDRMFRGDGLRGGNFHHAQMRAGNNGQSLESYLAKGGKADVYAVSNAHLIELAESSSLLRGLLPMARGEVTLSRGRDYAGYWFEQLILRDELPQWAWNTQGIHAEAREVLAAYGV